MLLKFVESRFFRFIVTALIFINAVAMGLQTLQEISQGARAVLSWVDIGCLAFFCAEMFLKIRAYRKRFFSDAWNCFDLIVIVISLMPQLGILSTVRVFRSLRVFRLLSMTRLLRLIVESIIFSLPGMGWTALLLMLIYYLYAIFGVNLYGQEFPDVFGSVQKSFFTLFQLMTLDGWSSELAGPIVRRHPYAWVYFVSFVLISSFVIMNVVVGIFVNTMGETLRRHHSKKTCKSSELEAELKEIGARLKRIEEAIAKKN